MLTCRLKKYVQQISENTSSFVKALCAYLTNFTGLFGQFRVRFRFPGFIGKSANSSEVGNHFVGFRGGLSDLFLRTTDQTQGI